MKVALSWETGVALVLDGVGCIRGVLPSTVAKSLLGIANTPWVFAGLSGPKEAPRKRRGSIIHTVGDDDSKRFKVIPWRVLSLLMLSTGGLSMALVS